MMLRVILLIALLAEGIYYDPERPYYEPGDSNTYRFRDTPPQHGPDGKMLFPEMEKSGEYAWKYSDKQPAPFDKWQAKEPNAFEDAFVQVNGPTPAPPDAEVAPPAKQEHSLLVPRKEDNSAKREMAARFLEVILHEHETDPWNRRYRIRPADAAKYAHDCVEELYKLYP